MAARRSALALLFAMWLAVASSAVGAPDARASRGQVSIFQDDMSLEADPALVLSQLRLLGASTVRVAARWSATAPQPNTRKRPSGFDAGDPGAPGYRWGAIDTIVRDAAAEGIQVELDIGNAAPLWATGSGAPHDRQRHYNWEPSASAFGQFVRAVGRRYSGAYQPPGASAPLPRVSSWAIWSEPNLGYSIAPQGVPTALTIENSGRIYRGLLGAAWTALAATGHSTASDQILIGELAPRGAPKFGVFGSMDPLVFLRALYCVDAAYRHLRGLAAEIRGCPSTPAGSRRFRTRNPALFKAGGIAVHLWSRWYPPNQDPQHDPNYSGLPDMGQLEHALDGVLGAYGSRRRIPVFNTEYGYITNPPNRSDPFVSPSTASYYLNWAEYISWRNPRIDSFAQYLLYDPGPNPGRYTGWSSGLETYSGRAKPTYDAWRLPLFLPVTSTGHGHSLEVWGCVRPAAYAILDTGQPQTAQIEFAPRGSEQYTALQAVRIGSGESCYFDLHLAFPSSGTVRLAYTYPPGTAGGATVYSRTVAVSVRR